MKKFEEFIVKESEVDLEWEDEGKIDNAVHNFLNDIERKFGKKGRKRAIAQLAKEK